MQRLLSLVLVSSFAPLAAAQITFPVGQTYGYSANAYADTSLSQATTDSAYQFFSVPSGATSLSFSDSVSATNFGSASLNPFDPPCHGRFNASVVDPGAGLPGTHYLQMTATSSSIQVSVDSETRHQAEINTNCCDGPLSVWSDEGGPNVGASFVVPFDISAPVTMTVQNVDVSSSTSFTESGPGHHTWSQTGSVRADLYRFQGGAWALFRSLTDVQFQGAFDYKLDVTGQYALAVKYTQADGMDSFLDSCPGAYFATRNFNQSAVVHLTFQ